MLSKEYKTIITGSLVFVVITSFFNLLLKLDLVLSLLAGIILGVAAGLLIGNKRVNK